MTAQNRLVTLQALDGEDLGEPTFDSHLVTRCHALRTKMLCDFSVEDLRIMIGQQIGLEHLIPIALEHLDQNPLVEGDFYPGDLLNAVLRVSPEFWKANESLYWSLREVLVGVEALAKVIKEEIQPAASRFVAIVPR